MIVSKIINNYYTILGFAFISSLFISSCETGSKNNLTGKQQAQAQWIQTADSLFNAVDSLSGVLLIAENDSILLLETKGFRDYVNKVPLEKSDIFELASVSKQFTAAAIMLLEQQGKLDYNDLLQDYFPNLPYDGVTIKQMLHHTSGLPDYMKLFYDHWDKTKVAGNKEILEYLERYSPPMLFEPGEKYEYSNTGYVLLASILEEVSGTDFIDFVDNELFEKAGLSQTAIRSKEEKLQMNDMAWGYIFDAEKARYMPADSFPYTDYATFLGERKGPGRVSSNASDLFKWDAFLRTGGLFADSTLQAAYSPAQLNNGESFPYGFGWDIVATEDGQKIIKHNGENPGYRTIFIRLPAKKRVVVLLTNNQPPGFGKLTSELEKLIIK